MTEFDEDEYKQLLNKLLEDYPTGFRSRYYVSTPPSHPRPQIIDGRTEGIKPIPFGYDGLCPEVLNVSN